MRKILGLKNSENNVYIISHDTKSNSTVTAFIDNTGKDFVGEFDKVGDREIYNELVRKGFIPLTLEDLNTIKCFDLSYGTVELVSFKYFFFKMIF